MDDDTTRVCQLLVEAIRDEDKATLEYETIKSELGRKADKNIINKIEKDEEKHAKKLRKLALRVNHPVLHCEGGAS
jgi:rubrerythrin